MAHRRLTLVLSALAFISNFGTLCLAHLLPDDPLHLARHIRLYAYFAGTLSVFGIVGAKRNDATLVTIFANYLLIDLVITTIQRLIALLLLPTITDFVCSADTIYAWLQSSKAPTSPSFVSLEYRNGAFLSNSTAVAAEMEAQCRRAVAVLLVLLTLVLVAGTAVQMALALRVSAYAGLLRRRERKEAEACGKRSIVGVGNMAEDKDALESV